MEKLEAKSSKGKSEKVKKWKTESEKVKNEKRKSEKAKNEKEKINSRVGPVGRPSASATESHGFDSGSR